MVFTRLLVPVATCAMLALACRSPSRAADASTAALAAGADAGDEGPSLSAGTEKRYGPPKPDAGPGEAPLELEFWGLDQ